MAQTEEAGTSSVFPAITSVFATVGSMLTLYVPSLDMSGTDEPARLLGEVELGPRLADSVGLNAWGAVV